MDDEVNGGGPRLSFADMVQFTAQQPFTLHNLIILKMMKFILIIEASIPYSDSDELSRLQNEDESLSTTMYFLVFFPSETTEPIVIQHVVAAPGSESRARADTAAEVVTLCEIESHRWRIFPTHSVLSCWNLSRPIIFNEPGWARREWISSVASFIDVRTHREMFFFFFFMFHKSTYGAAENWSFKTLSCCVFPWQLLEEVD